MRYNIRKDVHENENYNSFGISFYRKDYIVKVQK